VEGCGGLEAPVEICQKTPHKWVTLTDTPSGTGRAGFDGTIGWAQNMQGVREVSGEPLVRFNREYDLHREIRLSEHYTQLKLLGVTNLTGREAYVIEATPATGSSDKLYFDFQTGLLVRMDVLMGSPHQIYFGEYREVDGVKLPFSVRRSRPDFTFTHKFKEIRHNVPMDDEKFKKPVVP